MSQAIDLRRQKRSHVSKRRKPLQALQRLRGPADDEYAEAAIHLAIRVRPYRHCARAGGPFTREVVSDEQTSGVLDGECMRVSRTAENRGRSPTRYQICISGRNDRLASRDKIVCPTTNTDTCSPDRRSSPVSNHGGWLAGREKNACDRNVFGGALARSAENPDRKSASLMLTPGFLRVAQVKHMARFLSF